MQTTLKQKRSTKGNIPIKEELLNKYPDVETIFKEEKKNYKVNIIISNDIEELNNINIEDLGIKELKKVAYDIFLRYHNQRTFKNNTNFIIVNRASINESIQKIYHTRKQKELLKEHLKVFSCLGKIIEEETLVNQVYERKGRDKYKSWNYYLEGIIIDDKKYLIEFDVVTLNSGENHYRVQRLELL